MAPAERVVRNDPFEKVTIEQGSRRQDRTAVRSRGGASRQKACLKAYTCTNVAYER